MPLRAMVWIVNSGTRKTAHAQGLDLASRVYAEEDAPRASL